MTLAKQEPRLGEVDELVEERREGVGASTPIIKERRGASDLRHDGIKRTINGLRSGAAEAVTREALRGALRGCNAASRQPARPIR